MNINNIKERYLIWVRSTHYINIAKNIAITEIGKNQNILDIGPGKGEILWALSSKYKNNINIYALDRHNKVLEELPPNTNLIEMNLWDLQDYENGVKEIPIKSNKFDYVILTEVIEHVIFPQILISEISRILKPGGKLIISTPNIHMFGNRIAMLIGQDKIFRKVGAEGFISKINYHPYGHVGHYSVSSIIGLLTPWFNIKKKYGAGFNVPILRYLQPFFCRLLPTLATSIVILAEKIKNADSKMQVVNCPLYNKAQLVLPDNRCLHPQSHEKICKSCEYFHIGFDKH